MARAFDQFRFAGTCGFDHNELGDGYEPPDALNLTNLQNQVFLSPTEPVGFYRLATP